MGNITQGQYDKFNLQQNYQIVRVGQQSCIYLTQKETRRQYMYREYICNTEQDANKLRSCLQNNQIAYRDNIHVVSAENFKVTISQQLCSRYFLIQLIYPHPHKTLLQEFEDRVRQKDPFKQNQLLGILASCILAFSHISKITSLRRLQGHLRSLAHESIRLDSILISQSGIIQIADPFMHLSISNYSTIHKHKKIVNHIYLAPQLCELVRQEKQPFGIEMQKSDIFTFGMVILELGLLSNLDLCYQHNFKLDWEVCNNKIRMFSRSYSAELQNILALMLNKDFKKRPTWVELEQLIVNKKQIRDIPRQSGNPQFVQYQTRVILPNECLIKPVQKSAIEFVKPKFLSLPANTYQTYTSIDQNLIQLTESQQQSFIKGTNYHNLFSTQNEKVELYTLPYDFTNSQVIYNLTQENSNQIHQKNKGRQHRIFKSDEKFGQQAIQRTVKLQI